MCRISIQSGSQNAHFPKTSDHLALIIFKSGQAHVQRRFSRHTKQFSQNQTPITQPLRIKTDPHMSLL